MTLVAGPSLPRLIAVELRKASDTRAGFWMLLLTGVGAAGAVAIAAAAAHTADRTLSAMFSLALQTAGTVLPLLATLAVTSEWSKRTATTTFLLVPRRERVAAAKAAAALLLAVAATLLCLALALAAGLATSAGAGSFAVDTVGRAALYLPLWMLAGFAIGLALMSTPAAIGLQFLVPIVLVTLATALPATASIVHWFDLVTPSVQAVRFAEPFTGHHLAQLATGALLWVALPLAIGLLRLRRSEVAFA